jgi:hypothetical protein
LDKEHLDLLLGEHIRPPPIKKGQRQQDSIVKMGFPRRQIMNKPSFCTWLENFTILSHSINFSHELLGEKNSLSMHENGGVVRGFLCPQCNVI